MPAEGIPSDTFLEEHRRKFHNGDSIELFWEPNAVTDGDSIAHFRRADVIVTGDKVRAAHIRDAIRAAGPTVHLDHGKQAAGL